jgi:antitoxin (DNA-binding transcriptional repressor) of toxin-antitoxin stability system
METISFTDFRKQASHWMTAVESGRTLIIIRHGKPIAEIAPYRNTNVGSPAWQRPGLELEISGASLSDAILAEREELS